MLPINIEKRTNRVIAHVYPQEVEIESLFINAKNHFYDGFCSALYLNLAIKLFKSSVDSGRLPIVGTLFSMRNQFKQNNQLLTWFEEFYFSCCDGDWEHDGGGDIGLIATSNGWIFCFSVTHLEIVDKNFDGVIIEQKGGSVHCCKRELIYNNTKYESMFIIRAHPRGLITGLKIFKNWIEG